MSRFKQAREVHYKPSVQGRGVRTEEAGFIVMQLVVENPDVSSTQIGNLIGKTSATSVRRALKTYKYYSCDIKNRCRRFELLSVTSKQTE